MNKTILQVPMSTDLRKAAEREAVQQGFSSLQEIIRIFLRRLAKKEIEVTFMETVQLSPEAEERYAKIEDEFKKGKNVYAAKDIDDLMRDLHEGSTT